MSSASVIFSHELARKIVSSVQISSEIHSAGFLWPTECHHESEQTSDYRKALWILTLLFFENFSFTI